MFFQIGEIQVKIKNLAFSGVALAFITALPHVHAGEAKTKLSNGGIKFSQADAKIQFGGRFMFDYDYFDGVHNASNDGKSGSGSEIRRGRIYVKSQIDKNWEAKLQINIDDKGSSDRFEDAYLKYKGATVGSITIGKHKEPFGLEELTSSKYISTIERTMMTNAFAPGRSYGVSLLGTKGNLLYSGGIFSEAEDNSGKETYAFTGRLVYTPVKETNRLIHIGVAASNRDMGDNTFQVKERAEVHLANDKPATSLATNADSVNLAGVEFAGVWNEFSVQTEYQTASVNAVAGESDADYSGYYVMGSYFLTGESRPYKNGAFGKVKPKGDGGAWELVAKLSNLDAVDSGTGTETETTTLGLNYYANTSVRFMFNYLSTEVSGPSAGSINEGDAFSIRAQYIF